MSKCIICGGEYERDGYSLYPCLCSECKEKERLDFKANLKRDKALKAEETGYVNLMNQNVELFRSERDGENGYSVYFVNKATGIPYVTVNDCYDNVLGFLVESTEPMPITYIALLSSAYEISPALYESFKGIDEKSYVNYI